MIATRSNSIERPAARDHPRTFQAPEREADVDHRASLKAGKEPPTQLVSLEAVASLWWSALDAAETAINAAGVSLTAQELREFNAQLASERTSTAALLEEVARTEGIGAHFSHLRRSRSAMSTRPAPAIPAWPGGSRDG